MSHLVSLVPCPQGPAAEVKEPNPFWEMESSALWERATSTLLASRSILLVSRCTLSTGGQFLSLPVFDLQPWLQGVGFLHISGRILHIGSG